MCPELLWFSFLNFPAMSFGGQCTACIWKYNSVADEKWKCGLSSNWCSPCSKSEWGSLHHNRLPGEQQIHIAISTSRERRCLPLTARPLYRPRQRHSSLVGCWGLPFLVISRHMPVTNVQINVSWKTVCVLAISLAHQLSDHKLRFSHLKENKLWYFDHKLHKGNIHSLAYSRPLCLLPCQFQPRLLHNYCITGWAPLN